MARPFPAHRPYVYLFGLLQPRVPWTGNDKAGYTETLLRPEEKQIYVKRFSERPMPVVVDHAGQTEAGHALPPESVIGDTVGALHDDVGNLFQVFSFTMGGWCVACELPSQVIRIPTKRPEARHAWDALESGYKLGFSLWTDLKRQGGPKGPVVGVDPRHLGVTGNPAWGRVSEEDGPPEYDRGSFVRQWTGNAADVKRKIQEEFGSGFSVPPTQPTHGERKQHLPSPWVVVCTPPTC